MKHNLSLLTFYLSGAIDLSPTGGTTWRDEITQKLIRLGIPSENIYSPTNKPIENNMELSAERELIHDLRKRKAWKQLEDVVTKIVKIDLRLTDISSVIILYMEQQEKVCDCFNCLEIREHWEEFKNHKVGFKEKFVTRLTTPTFGSIHEAIIGLQAKKPVLMIHPGGLKEVSAWMLSIIGREYIFESIDECMDYLKDVRDGKVDPDPKKWLFLDRPKDNLTKGTK